MKYLKRIFESKKSLNTNILGDILLEITDLGYRSHIENNWWSDDRGNSIRITIYGKDEYDKEFNCDVSYIYPDEIIETVDRLIDFLGSEDYYLWDHCEKAVEVIKNRPTEKTEDDVKISTSKYSQVTLRWDDNIKGYKVCYSISLDFKQ